MRRGDIGKPDGWNAMSPSEISIGAGVELRGGSVEEAAHA